jgi:hypothetical protein
VASLLSNRSHKWLSRDFFRWRSEQGFRWEKTARARLRPPRKPARAAVAPAMSANAGSDLSAKPARERGGSPSRQIARPADLGRGPIAPFVIRSICRWPLWPPSLRHDAADTTVLLQSAKRTAVRERSATSGVTAVAAQHSASGSV